MQYVWHRCIEGHVWVSQLDDVQRENVLKRIPFVEYSFIIKNDFDRVKNNNVLNTFGRVEGT